MNAIDANSNTIHIIGHEPVVYDQLSIDIGAAPDLAVPGAKEYATGVKPVSQLGQLWNSL